MNQMKNFIEAKNYRMTDKDCQDLIKLFDVNDERSELISLADAMLGQFHAHWYVASKTVRGETFNAYWGKADGTHGVYPIFDKSSILMDDEGKFVLNEKGDFASVGRARVAPDEHRVNENRALTANHLLAANFHNKRIDEHGNYSQAKSEVVACFQHAFMAMTENVTGMKSTEIMNGVKLVGFADSLEFAMAVGRYGHPLMPSTIDGEPLFSKDIPITDVDFKKMTAERAGKLGMRISPPMSNNSEGGKGKSILEHTVGTRHNQHNLCDFEELAEAMGFIGRHSNIGLKYCPMFVGIMKEAEIAGTGLLGRVGARAVADGMASTFDWAKGSMEGLWHPRWEGAPSTLLEIAEYTYT